MKHITTSSSKGGGTADSSLFLVLIDTDGFDCKIINGMDLKTLYKPKYIIFEKYHCDKKDVGLSLKHLESMGYFVESRPGRMDDIAILHYQPL